MPYFEIFAVKTDLAIPQALWPKFEQELCKGAEYKTKRFCNCKFETQTGPRKTMDSSTFLKGFCFAIDRGGTFTDVFAKTPTGKSIVMKLLSEDPANYPDAPREGIRRILEQV